jgi:hypothetical protein
VKNFGSDVVWDCEYRSVEECTPHVIAGDRSFCKSQSVAGSGNAVAARGSPQAPGGSLKIRITVVKFAPRNLLPEKHITDCKRGVNAIV